MTGLPRKYDVAISFLSTDEATAAPIASQAAEFSNVFIYTEHQRELVGNDGMDAYSRVFAEESLIVVVLYRQGWGESSWTRVEETAIKNRSNTDGWDFLLLISMDGTAPKWTPKAQVWLHWEKYGIEGAVPVIERKITELGGIIHETDAVSHAAAVERRTKAEYEAEAILSSHEGVTIAKDEASVLIAELERLVKNVAATAPSLGIRSERHREGAVNVTSNGRSVTVAWVLQYGNTLEGSYLFVRTLAGRHSFHGFGGGPLELKREMFHFSIGMAGERYWVTTESDLGRRTSKQLADVLIREVVDHATDRPRGEH